MKIAGIITVTLLLTIAVLSVFSKIKSKEMAAQNEGESGTSTMMGPADKCIISVFGQEYDIGPFRALHPGGDVFKCGEDMTETFMQQHGKDLKRIEKFLVRDSKAG